MVLRLRSCAWAGNGTRSEATRVSKRSYAGLNGRLFTNKINLHGVSRDYFLTKRLLILVRCPRILRKPFHVGRPAIAGTNHRSAGGIRLLEERKARRIGAARL